LSYYYAGALLPARVKYGRDRILVDSRGARDLLQRGLGEAALREQFDGNIRYLQQRLLLAAFSQRQ
jgi:hypothetical protein